MEGAEGGELHTSGAPSFGILSAARGWRKAHKGQRASDLGHEQVDLDSALCGWWRLEAGVTAVCVLVDCNGKRRTALWHIILFPPDVSCLQILLMEHNNSLTI